ncbi:hypothetical protein [Aquimarina sp. 2201CG5-10]|uniref:hypothetical protein n=1 Tax=Aquimarina callyspongiae TaxID=3098150 RepID=UPI002AB5251E|nr:hypothetical protein [Aquimarina sp. 2201CG5-10]MDY8138316.1 hypothetical protein [Aquimarina sp. 2201CG5-10]
MHTKILALQNVQKLSKKEQSLITGSYANECNSNGGGSTGQSCTTASQCRPLLPGFPVACFRGCCISAF